MTKVNLVFTSILKMWDFKQVLKRRPMETNLRKKLITCSCTEEEIKLAAFAYEARVEELA